MNRRPWHEIYFQAAYDGLPNRSDFPEKSYLGDIIKLNDEPWVYDGKNWMRLEDAFKQIHVVGPL